MIFILLRNFLFFPIEPVRESLKKSIDVVVSFFHWKHLEQLFLIPMTMWTTIETAFLTAQFTRVKYLFVSVSFVYFIFKAFITCLVGIR